MCAYYIHICVYISVYVYVYVCTYKNTGTDILKCKLYLYLDHRVVGGFNFNFHTF